MKDILDHPRLRSKYPLSSGDIDTDITLWGVQIGSRASSTLADVAPKATFLHRYARRNRAEKITFSSPERFFVTDGTLGAISPERRPHSASQNGSSDHAEYAFFLADAWL